MRTIICLLFLQIASIAILNGQGGGPPMITDDPGTPDKGNWEINFSVNSDLRKHEKEIEAPLVDVNYGLNERTQLKLEFPYLFAKTIPDEYKGRFGDVTFGIKYRFLNEEKSCISLSIYPQISVATESAAANEYQFPLQIEKCFGKVILGLDIRYVYINGDEDFIQNGLLFGLELSERFVVMGEFVYWLNAKKIDNAESLVNLGMKYQINDLLTFMTSVGTGLFSSVGDLRTTFISFAGVQINLGSF